MNARSHVFEIAVEARQVEEAISSIIHTVLFHRSFGKITYQNDRDYCEKTIGYEDVDCDYIGGNFCPLLRTHCEKKKCSKVQLISRAIFHGFPYILQKTNENFHIF